MHHISTPQNEKEKYYAFGPHNLNTHCQQIQSVPLRSLTERGRRLCRSHDSTQKLQDWVNTAQQ